MFALIIPHHFLIIMKMLISIRHLISKLCLIVWNGLRGSNVGH